MDFKAFLYESDIADRELGKVIFRAIEYAWVCSSATLIFLLTFFFSFFFFHVGDTTSWYLSLVPIGMELLAWMNGFSIALLKLQVSWIVVTLFYHVIEF
jgi:hypothetical protein